MTHFFIPAAMSVLSLCLASSAFAGELEASDNVKKAEYSDSHFSDDPQYDNVEYDAETQLSIVSMILGGGFDRVSEQLKICFAHGGGAFAFLLGRLENAWHFRDIARGKSQFPPSHYLDRFYLDTAVFDHDSLDLLVKKMTTKKLMFGTDYPFPLGEQKMGQLIKTSSTLTPMEQQQLLASNAEQFFNLPISV